MSYRVGQRATHIARPKDEYRITDVRRQPDGMIFTLTSVKTKVATQVAEHELNSALWTVK